jgi:hypothetical protein
VFGFNHRTDRRNVSVRIKVWDSAGAQVVDFYNSDHAPQPDPPAKTWIWKQPLADGLYLVEVTLENQLAYRSLVPLGDSLF